MKPEEFNQIVVKRVEQSADVLTAKGHQYSRNNDRLHNFKKIAQLTDTTPEKVLMTLVSKHWISLNDCINDVGLSTNEWFPLYDELFNDIHNYMYLLEGLIKERCE